MDNDEDDVIYDEISCYNEITSVPEVVTETESQPTSKPATKSINPQSSSSSSSNSSSNDYFFIVIALYSYSTLVEGDLTFSAGDFLRISRFVDDQWYEGSSSRDGHASLGIFPKSYVTPRVDDRDFVNIFDLFPKLKKRNF